MKSPEMADKNCYLSVVTDIYFGKPRKLSLCTRLGKPDLVIKIVH